MTWICKGALITQKNVPQFCTPMFSSQESTGYYAQSVNHFGQIKGMVSVGEEYINSMRLLSAKSYVRVDIRSPIIYGFYIAENRFLIERKHKMIGFINENLPTIQKYPFTYLSVVRFLGMSLDAEVLAIQRASNSIENKRVRKFFAEFETYIARESWRVDHLIDQLKQSSSYFATHEIIARLMFVQNSFQSHHFGMALNACLQNDQVYGISRDPDVKEFMQFLIKSGEIEENLLRYVKVLERSEDKNGYLHWIRRHSSPHK